MTQDVKLSAFTMERENVLEVKMRNINWTAGFEAQVTRGAKEKSAATCEGP